MNDVKTIDLEVASVSQSEVWTLHHYRTLFIKIAYPFNMCWRKTILMFDDYRPLCVCVNIIHMLIV